MIFFIYYNLVLYNQNILKKEFEHFNFTKRNVPVQTKQTFANIPMLRYKLRHQPILIPVEFDFPLLSFFTITINDGIA